MSAALKRPGVTPAPFGSAERAALAAAIVAVQASAARLAGLEKAVATANAEMRQALVEVERCDGAIVEASENAIKYLTDQAMGTAGEPPQTVREAKAALAEARDRLEACREAKAALTEQLAKEKPAADLPKLRLDDAVRNVIRSEMQTRANALVDRVRRLQKELVETGSGLQWLAALKVFPLGTELGSYLGQPSSAVVRHTLERMELPPMQWSTPRFPHEAPFAAPSGAQRWQAAFEALQRDASWPLPTDPET